nr:uncharacterized protein LOC131787490 [Pocillopora verrucosa]
MPNLQHSLLLTTEPRKLVYQLGTDSPQQASITTDQEKSQVPSSGKSKDLEIGKSTGTEFSRLLVCISCYNGWLVALNQKSAVKVKEIQEKLDLNDKHSSVGKEDNMEADKNLAAADNGSPVITATQVEAAEGNEDFPFNNSSGQIALKKESDGNDNKLIVTKEAQVEEAEGNQYLTDNSSLGADKSEASSSDNGVDFYASLSVAATSEGKDSANQEKVNLEDELLSEQEKSQVLSSGISKDLEIGSSKGSSEEKVKAIQEKLDLDDKLSSDHFTSKKESDDDGSKSKVIKETQVEAAEGNEDFPFNNSSENKTSDDKDVDLDDDPLVVRAKDCFQQGNKEYRQGDFHRALQLYTEGLQLNCKDNRLTARLYNNRAAAHFRLENFENSLDDATVAVQLEPTFIKALEKGQFKTAIEYHKQDLEIVKEVGDKNGIADALCRLATNFERQECLQTALDYYISSREIFNNVRASFLLHHNWKISYRNVHKTAYNGVWRVLLLKGEHVKALLAAEEGRAQALRDIVDLKYSFRQTLTWSNSRKCSDCLSLRNVSSDVVFLAITGPYIALWTIRNGEVVQSRIKHVNNFLYQRELEVYITSLNKAASLQVSARAAVEWEKSSTQVGRDEKGTSDGSPRNATTNALRKLYDIIVAPIADLIDGDELVFVPEGPLCLVPYAALVDSNSRYLCESFRIRVIPSLTILKSISDCPTELHNKTGALLVGDPCYKQVLYQGDLLNQLPGARKEVKMIGGILGIAPLVGGEATKEEVFRRISSVALVHIAAHGKKETGEILLAPNTSRTTCQAEEEDYLLTMRDVLRAGLRAKLVVLSCCHSACGEVMAEGVVGIARAFLGAGARSVLVSLWAIDDDGTQEFMKHFYGALEEGKGTSEAVNQAMKCMRESETFSKGYYWAPFVLIGDDVKLELTEIKRSSLMDLFEDKRRPQAFGTD